MYSTLAAAAGKMVRSRTKGYVVRFSELVQYFRRLEGTSGRNALVEVLAELFARTPTEDVPPTAYLLQGRLAPYFEPVEIGLGNNYVADAIARAFGSDGARAFRPSRRHWGGSGRDCSGGRLLPGSCQCPSGP